MNDDPSKKFFDVARPGRTAPSSTSRPVITGNTTQVDPMMHEPSAFDLQPQASTTPAPDELPVDAPTPTPPAAHEPDPLPAEAAPQPVIDASQAFKPRKPTKSFASRLITLIVVLVVIAVLTLGVYPLIRSQF